ncbi:coiled-coil domain-containing protein 177-like [Oryza brachyantha]|uniref:coiled-coil domain-containing protein 177-like n=1 Tax=Oryza brachyantha TaxID=4533 RepID=UPI001ADAFB3F|nr:coiled-coil domain-containing protein 177-like [Oryza brachyantha]
MLRRGAVVVVDEDGEVVATKIRKRCALSSSGASDPLRKLRLKKRGVVVLGRRGGGGGVVVSPRSSRKMSESSWNGRRCHDGAAAADGTRSAASARKLVGALRQLSKGGSSPDEDAARRSSAHRRCVSVEFSKRSRTKSKALEADEQRSWHNGHGRWFSDMFSNGSTMEVHACRPPDCASPCAGGETMEPHLKEMYGSLAASKELVKALAGIWGPGDLNPSTASLLSALRAELDLARAHARQLIKEERRRGDEAERMRRQLAEEVREWRGRQREKAAATVRVVVAELDGERRSRRRAERVNAKLGKALADAERELAAARRELERERRSRERLEKVCDELVRGGLAVGGGSVDGRGGDDVEEMRREAERAQEELEKEREMLRLADELREERVQMKLLEARLQFEEKNAVVEQLRGELEAFLESKKDRQQEPHDADEHRLDGRQLQSILANKNGEEGNVRDGDVEDDGGRGECVADDSDGSETHSIELNMDGNSWSYTTASKDTTTTRSKNAAAVHGSHISDRGAELAAGPWSIAAIDQRSQEDAGEELDGDRWHDGGCSDRSKDLDEEDAERYQAIKNLREQMLAGHGFVFVSQEWGQC